MASSASSELKRSMRFIFISRRRKMSSRVISRMKDGLNGSQTAVDMSDSVVELAASSYSLSLYIRFL